LARGVRILGVDVDAVSMAEAVAVIDETIDARRGHGGLPLHVATVNPEFVMRARHDDAFREALAGAGLHTADGAGLLLAARILGRRLPARVTGMELVRNLAAAAVSRGDRVFFLGAAPGVGAEAASVLGREFPGLQVAGDFGGDAGEAGDVETVAAVRGARSDIVLVAYGAPKQELWLSRNLQVCGASVGIGVGGTFDYISGRVPRAPAWMRRLGLEWLYRLVQQPSRAGRMLVLPGFLLLVIRQRFFGS
jgi:N-acetylglucosaminyldiphosphoundecaprenol N-acetyl-beta-D-mannosaminyltransferase